MKTIIATVCFLAVICLPAAAESPGNRTEQDTLKTRIYEGSVSVGYTHMLNFGVRTTHGVRYLDKNLFLGGELWVRKGFQDGFSIRAGFLPRWYFVANRHIDTYLGCAVGLTTCSDSPPDVSADIINTFDIGAYFSPEIGIGIRLGNGDYIDLAFDFPLMLWFFNRTSVSTIYDKEETIVKGAKFLFEYRQYPGISIGYRF